MSVTAHARRAIWRRRLVGALVLAAAVGAAMVLWQRPDPLASRQTVTAEIADADGLAAIGADVRVAGVPVGKVAGVRRNGTHAELTLVLDSSAGEVHRDATIALRPRLMFDGTAYVQLTLGTPAAPALRSRPIPLSHSATYVPLDDALSVLNSSTSANVRTVVRSVAGVLSAQAPVALRETIAAAPRLLGDAAVDARAAQGPTGGELRTAVSALGRDASAVAEQAPALSASLGHASAVAAALETGAGRPLDRSLALLPATAAQLRTGARAADSIVASLQRLIPRLQPAVGQLQPTLGAVRPLLRQVVPLMGPVTRAMGRLRTAIAGALRGAAPATAAVGALQPTLNIFQSTLLSSLEGKTDLGTPAYLAFLGLFAGGGGASRPFGVDGQGHFMRFGLRFLTGVGQPLPPCSLVDKLSSSLGGLLAKSGGCTP